MTGACSNTFHQFEQGADRDTITEALLCNATSVTGPGEIYRLHFRASATPQVTTVRFLPGLQFYDAGLYVTPVASSDATIGIGGAAAVGDPGGAGFRLRVRASPNPAHGAATLRVDSDRPGMQELLVLDALGRVVRHVERGEFEAAARAIVWDGRSDAGARLPAGVYTILLRTPAGAARTHLILID